jgi:EAL domain-containing protein (putative c-di-GMP-specific phosphodiesterase class I)/AmiR/NasT family two-component response regulator
MSRQRTLHSVSDARVVVIDDNPANTALLRGILAKSGLTDVVEIHDPLQVMPQMDAMHADLVLLDLRMPGMDGFELLALIQQWAAGTFLPVIIVSSDDSQGSVERALDRGAHDFVVKPVQARELVLRVRNLLLQRRAYQELRRSRAWLRTRLDLFEPGTVMATLEPDTVRKVIRDLLDHGGLRIALQPIVDLRDGTVRGSEALARFPVGVLGDTTAWLGAAAEVGLGIELEIAAARAALRHAAHHTTVMPLAVNVSPGAVLAGLHQLGDDVPWDRVVLELTEHLPVEDYAVLNRALAPWREAGARLAVDDTGAGFASLRHILDLHPDFIKLDIGIVRGLDRDHSRAAMAEMLVRFAARVGIRVVAEGIETEAERAALVELGAEWGQGYLLGRPAIVDPDDD